MNRIQLHALTQPNTTFFPYVAVALALMAGVAGATTNASRVVETVPNGTALRTFGAGVSNGAAMEPFVPNPEHTGRGRTLFASTGGGGGGGGRTPFSRDGNNGRSNCDGDGDDGSDGSSGNSRSSEVKVHSINKPHGLAVKQRMLMISEEQKISLFKKRREKLVLEDTLIRCTSVPRSII